MSVPDLLVQQDKQEPPGIKRPSSSTFIRSGASLHKVPQYKPEDGRQTTDGRRQWAEDSGRWAEKIRTAEDGGK